MKGAQNWTDWKVLSGHWGGSRNSGRSNGRDGCRNTGACLEGNQGGHHSACLASVTTAQKQFCSAPCLRGAHLFPKTFHQDSRGLSVPVTFSQGKELLCQGEVRVELDKQA